MLIFFSESVFLWFSVFFLWFSGQRRFSSLMCIPSGIFRHCRVDINFKREFFAFSRIVNFKHRCEAVVRKHLRTFENQISNIIRRTKGKRTLKFHQFYNIQGQKIPERIRISLENHSSPTENSEKPIFLNEKPLKNRKLSEKIFENI